MALLFMDGFDHVDDGYATIKYGNIANVSYISGYGRTGGFGVSINYVGYCERSIPDTNEIVVGFAFRCADYDRDYFLILKDDTTAQIALRYNSAGVLSVYRGTTLISSTGTGIISYNVWNYIEIKTLFSNTVGTVEVRVNGVTLINLTGIDTCSNSNEHCNVVSIRGANSSTRFDDLYVCDTTGTENNDFLGDVTITTLYPTSDGNSSDFTPSTGVDNYATVDEPQLTDETDYNTATVIGEKDTFGMTTLDGNANILAVQTVAAVNNLTTGTVNVRGISRSGATPADNEGSDFALSQTVKAAMDIFEKEPTDDVAWDVAKVNAAEFGIKVQS